MAYDWQNKLYFGDNLEILRQHIADESVDLIYLDPPFNSNATYNVLFRERSGEDSAAQITAFDDTWRWSMESEAAYQDVVTDGPDRLGKLLIAMREFLGQNDMMAYLTMMAQRLAELRRVLKPSGSIYLHCDPNRKPLSQTDDGRRIRLQQFSERSHLVLQRRRRAKEISRQTPRRHPELRQKSGRTILQSRPHSPAIRRRNHIALQPLHRQCARRSRLWRTEVEPQGQAS